MSDNAQENKVVTIPGISGRPPKEISFKSLAHIIQSRMEEIIDAVTFEIENSECENKLSAGLVLTGGGALLKHLPQLVKFRTGMDVRIGMPNEHLNNELNDEVNHPMYSTSVGLILKGYEYLKVNDEEKKEEVPLDEIKSEEDENNELVDEKAEGKNDTNKSGLFDSLKTKITKIFEEDDAQM